MKRLLSSLALVIAVISTVPAHAAKTADEVVQCMRQNFPTTIGIRDVRLTTTSAAGTTTQISGRVYGTLEEQANGRSLIRGTLFILEPRNLYGSAYLVRETEDFLRDGMFVYIPSVGRVRRISGNFADNAMLGTEFSYFEFKQIMNAFGDLSGQYVREETIEGRKTHVINFNPLDGLETRYTRVTTWIDQPTCLVVKAEFRQGDKLIKQMIAPAKGLRKAGEHWYHSEIRMLGLANKGSTILNIDQVTANETLSSYRFHPKTFFELR